MLLDGHYFFGLGFKFRTIVHNSYTIQLMGMESIWFRVLTECGFVGAFANIFLALYSIYILPKRFHSKSAFFLALSYWIVNTTTSTPGMLVHLYYIVYFFFLKKDKGEYKK